MGFLLDIAVSVLSSVEAKAKAIRQKVTRLGIGCALFAAALVFLVVALGFMLWGIYAALAAGTGPIAAAFITGAIVLLVAALLALIAKALTR